MIQIIDNLIPLIRQGIPCLFHLFTGIYCPGCGGTRAAKFLLHGQIGKSLQYHPLVLYMALILLIECVSWGVSKACRRPKLHIRRYDLFTYVGVGIIVGNWFWKNYMLVVRGIDLLP